MMSLPLRHKSSFCSSFKTKRKFCFKIIPAYLRTDLYCFIRNHVLICIVSGCFFGLKLTFILVSCKLSVLIFAMLSGNVVMTVFKNTLPAGLHLLILYLFDYLTLWFLAIGSCCFASRIEHNDLHTLCNGFFSPFLSSMRFLLLFVPYVSTVIHTALVLSNLFSIHANFSCSTQF